METVEVAVKARGDKRTSRLGRARDSIWRAARGAAWKQERARDDKESVIFTKFLYLLKLM